jgi:hypothetical protein
MIYQKEGEDDDFPVSTVLFDISIAALLFVGFGYAPVRETLANHI